MEENLFQLTQMVALKTKGLRCSVVHCMTHEKGKVFASNDNKNIAGFALDLKKYPEIQLVSNMKKTVVIDNLEESRALSQIKKDFRDIDFNGMVVSPIQYRHKPFGVLSLRMPRDERRISDSHIEFVDFMAKVISLYLSTLDPSVISRYSLLGVPESK